jgi:hypothetical protein
VFRCGVCSHVLWKQNHIIFQREELRQMKVINSFRNLKYVLLCALKKSEVVRVCVCVCVRPSSHYAQDIPPSHTLPHIIKTSDYYPLHYHSGDYKSKNVSSSRHKYCWYNYALWRISYQKCLVILDAAKITFSYFIYKLHDFREVLWYTWYNQSTFVTIEKCCQFFSLIGKLFSLS